MRRSWDIPALLCMLCAASAACSGTAPGGADAAPGVDATTGAGLVFDWSAIPQPPVAVEDDLELEDARFRLRALKAVGDAAPGDERTTRAEHEVRWNETTAPSPLVFDNAPPGYYSQFEFRIDGDGGQDSFVLKGRVRLEGEWEPFEIEDDRALNVSLALGDLLLSAGAQQTVGIDFNLRAALDAIDFQNLPIDDGKRVLEGDSAQGELFRERLLENIAIGAVTTIVLN